MFFWPFSKKYNLNKLDSFDFNRNSIRRLSKICIVDDETKNVSLTIKRLRNYGFNLQHFTDINNIESIQDFDVLICDIQGVGKTLGSEIGGWSIIKETKNKYPDKYIIVASALNFPVKYKKYFDLTDASLRKDDDVEVWVDQIDFALQCVMNPKQRWIRIRKYLVDLDIDIDQVAKLEKAYVYSVIKGQPYKFENMSAQISQEQSIDAILTIGKSISGFILLVSKLGPAAS